MPIKERDALGLLRLAFWQRKNFRPIAGTLTTADDGVISVGWRGLEVTNEYRLPEGTLTNRLYARDK
jgi:hypothetical protein